MRVGDWIILDQGFINDLIECESYMTLSESEPCVIIHLEQNDVVVQHAKYIFKITIHEANRMLGGIQPQPLSMNEVEFNFRDVCANCLYFDPMSITCKENDVEFILPDEDGIINNPRSHTCKSHRKHPAYLKMNEYQLETRSTAEYPGGTSVEYCIMGLLGEAGEIANKYKKVLRGDMTIEEAKPMLKGEIGDTQWYLARLADELGYDLGEIAADNLTKLADRKKRGVIKGNGDDR